MPQITYIEHDGTEHKVTAQNGQSVMQAAVNNDIEAIVAECGGACSCATCHCYIQEEWFEKTGPVDDMERSLLDFVPSPEPNSRLSCQITITDDLDGLVVRLPESQY
ncbi:ferredoxin, 2Fe-2S [Parasphingorhabdus marina DSM 22363]|uniref:Ferredoxin, 2Fe-2S n=1 Tax=Parasphingorhabdus marina DSM 22363 TaxID=1123272 RepID=A0A1N6DA05_9SPHN|nr:2Fe-2S iron-sulfur cluster-binding protein [Parasphingorhabdus marina]SIN67533.1 ferredoxin, 2Fe-2S [Parasphingorhabdus marina DSM 22363]